MKVSTNTITLNVGDSTTFLIDVSDIPASNISNSTLHFVTQHEDVIQISPTTALLVGNATKSTLNISVTGLEPGNSRIEITLDPSNLNKSYSDHVFMLVHVGRTKTLQWLSSAMGWMYFLSWSFYYYPQICTNFKRKSVVGLNFDYLLFGIVGYLMYDMFNMGLFFVPAIQEQYSQRYPGSIIPVEPNDIVASTHSTWAYSLTIFQCFIYERGGQKISVTAKAITGLYILAFAVYEIRAALHVILWLDVLYLCSYIKLCVNVTHYVPQVHMNYKRKSTDGWSVGGAILDFSGGLLSVLQMVLNGYNYADWKSVIANPTKISIGILSSGFSVVLMIQHFVLYRKK